MLSTKEIQSLFWSLTKILPKVLSWKTLSKSEKVKLSTDLIEIGTQFAEDIAD